MKILSAIILSALFASISGCVVAQEPAYECVVDANGICIDVAFEPDVIIGGYYLGFFRPGFGYWTGYGWDFNFYGYGHPGYGHYYRGAPHGAYGHYRSGPHFRGERHGGHRR